MFCWFCSFYGASNPTPIDKPASDELSKIFTLTENSFDVNDSLFFLLDKEDTKKWQDITPKLCNQRNLFYLYELSTWLILSIIMIFFLNVAKGRSMIRYKWNYSWTVVIHHSRLGHTMVFPDILLDSFRKLTIYQPCWRLRKIWYSFKNCVLTFII